MEPGSGIKKKIKTSTGLIVIFAAVVLFFGGALSYWYYTDPNSYDTSKDSTIVATVQNSNTNTSNANGNGNANVNNNLNSSNANTNASAAGVLTYTNTAYRFTLTLPSTWSTYKVKQANIEGALNTYYFELPTTDPLYADATTTADAGYAAPFVIGVMNKSEWTGDELQQRDFGSKIGENANYVFTASYWQAEPTDLSDTIAAEAINIVSTFKLQ